jgi:hypothetical protein
MSLRKADLPLPNLHQPEKVNSYISTPGLRRMALPKAEVHK